MPNPAGSDKRIDPIKDKTSWKEFPWLWLKGFLMGSADIIPGVSGGTMAFITGIYDRLIYAIKSADGRVVMALARLRIPEIFRLLHWKFLFLLLSGILSAVFFFTNVIPLQVYMHTYPEIVFGLFFGLIAGSILVLLKEVEPSERSGKSLLALVLGALFGFWIVTLVPTDTPDTFFYTFFSGMIAFCAMILPGISGSYLLLILGKYEYILGQLSLLGEETLSAVVSLIPLFIGGALGLILFSRVLTWLLKQYHTMTLMVLIGFLVGSLYVIWPYQERTYEEFVRHVELYSMDDPQVVELRNRPADKNRPEFLELGDVIDTGPASPDQIEVREISRKLIHSEPFIPGISGENQPEDYHLWGGIIGMIIGVILVAGIDVLREKK